MSFWKRLLGIEKKRPAYWETYKRSLKDTFPGSLPLEKARFVVFDTETTGLDPSQDHLLSIGAVGISGMEVRVSDSFECIISQAEVRKESIAVHGLTPGQVQAGMEEEEAIRAFIKYIEGSILVAHHAAFDKAMINRAIKKRHRARLLNKTVDTANLAIRLENFGAPPESFRRGEYSLDNLCDRYQIRMHDRHTAPGDSFLTALLFLKLLRLAHKRGIKTVGDLLS